MISAAIQSELRAMVRAEIKQQMQVILYGLHESGDKNTAKVSNVVPGSPVTESRPLMAPFGLASRAPKGKLAVTGRVGDHPAARLILGYRDDSRPEMEEGEAVLYNAHGQEIRLENGAIKIGSAAANEPVVLGLVLKTLLEFAFDTLIAGDFLLTTSPGNPTAPNPAKAAELTAKKNEYLTTAATNILSQLSFTERGA
jgi:hypothetical protein